MDHQAQLVVVKIGSNVLTKDDGSPDRERMASLVKQLVFLKEQGLQVVLVSSGAVAFARNHIKFDEKTESVVRKQILASVGQIDIIHAYKDLFQKEGHQIAQIVVTPQDFRSRRHYLNIKDCLLGLLNHNVIPIINENDAVAVTELMFTDNDELASMTAAMIDADTLVLLTNVDGIYKGHPDDPNSVLIERVGRRTSGVSRYISSSKSNFGRGGMQSKMKMAKKAAYLGIHVYIANGNRDNVLLDFYNKELKATYFEPESSKPNPKKWVAHSDNYTKGEVYVNEGAKEALHSTEVTSLLPVGIIKVTGNFSKGDVIRIRDEHGEKIGLGKAEYGSTKANERIGMNNQKPLVHYNYLYLFKYHNI
ncbi:glutamate 5-kinase [Pontibacter silvestris]|uniref:Glutamate 5-kinase n=1 Tax=Pontibacter silvestris TaxID=2305183 RepID=A0ABW4WX40_9BACT|nr:glutamate 5-kinase [Pontibacter silvestris]MCC9138371.1 glutamate 5-kinase [Pontibacter silvestris]